MCILQIKIRKNNANKIYRTTKLLATEICFYKSKYSCFNIDDNFSLFNVVSLLGFYVPNCFTFQIIRDFFLFAGYHSKTAKSFFFFSKNYFIPRKTNNSKTICMGVRECPLEFFVWLMHFC